MEMDEKQRDYYENLMDNLTYLRGRRLDHALAILNQWSPVYYVKSK